MKRFHVHVGVADLDAGIRFYSGLFGAPPTVRRPDYAKWRIDEPSVNFAISTAVPERRGVRHLGIEADSSGALASIRQAFAATGAQVEDEPDARCCYARSDKHWVTDPQGIRWEGFHSHGSAEDEAAVRAVPPGATACCGTPAGPSDCCGTTAAPAAAGPFERRCG